MPQDRPRRPRRPWSVAAELRRPGSDERGEDDDVRFVAPRIGVELATTGDQPQPRMIEIPVDLKGREVAFRHSLDGVDGELGHGAVRPSDINAVTRLEI